MTAPVALAELMRFLRPSTLLVRCFAWSSRLAVCSCVRVSRSERSSFNDLVLFTECPPKMSLFRRPQIKIV